MKDITWHEIDDVGEALTTPDSLGSAHWRDCEHEWTE